MIPYELKRGKITILGGTGSLGKALAPEIHHRWPKAEITIVSRDEHKHAAMKRTHPYCKFAVGDIRDANNLRRHFEGRDIIFHVAALKHVDILENCPMESIKTNVLATEGLAELAERTQVPHFIFSSTDKAIDPINTYGYSKALSEKLLYDMNSKQKTTRFSVYRWGNVVGSQGSAIPYFVQTLQNEGKAYITDKEMTRFWITIEHAVKYMLRTFHEANTLSSMVPPNMKAAPVWRVIATIAEILDIKGYQLVETGMRPGEKIHEAMYSQHSREYVTSQTAQQYTTGELIDLLLPIVKPLMIESAA